MPRRNVSLNIFFPFLILVAFSLSAEFSSASGILGIPDNLTEWQSWVLHGMEERLCPTDYNDSENYRCAWPSRLELYMEQKDGRFEQEWIVFADLWAPLPGEPGKWPMNVELDGKSVPVVNRNKVPFVWITRGKHRLKGFFEWSEMPETIQVPNSVGLINLFLNSNSVDSPVFDKTGRLWLQKQKGFKIRENRLEIRIARLLKDSIPMEVVNHIQMDVSGQSREIILNRILLKGSIPIQLESPVPARFSPDGGLMIQARPGRWTIKITSHQKGPVLEMGPVSGEYGRETWSFRSQNHLRMVKITGVSSIDPGQTDIPGNWKGFPAYLIDPGARMVLKEIRRGDPSPAPDRLNLDRTWWLDFDGGGFTVHDKITGTMSRQWYLAMNLPGEPGRISVDGQDRLITAFGKEKKAGVELRRGRLNLDADSRYTRSTKVIPAVGWDHNFQKVNGIMNLPAGWHLFFASGVDILPGTWLQRWTLLDLFIVLIIGIAVFKIRNASWGGLALVTMILIYHEPGSPRLIFLHILAAVALLNVLPRGWLRRLVNIWGFCSIIVLLVLAIPFIVEQVRTGIYPQLEHPGFSRTFRPEQKNMLERSVDKVADTEQVDGGYRHLKKYTASSLGSQEKSKQHSRTQAVLAQDPDAMIQTGPGLPRWKWQTIRMKWNGPVDKNQHIRLWLISPAVNLILAFVRVFLLAFMVLGLIDVQYWLKSMNKNLGKAGIIALMLLPIMSSGKATAADYPSPALLQELQDRLLEKPKCLPHCADISKMELNVSQGNLRISLRIHANSRVAVPLPGTIKSWAPEEVFLDQETAGGLLRGSDGLLWTLIPKGIHTVILIGKTGDRESIQIPMPLKPHHVTVSSEGWDIQGVRKDGTVESGIQLTRKVKINNKAQAFTNSIRLKPFLHVERILHLGLNWQVTTTVTRLTPSGIPVVVSVPLLEDESVITDGVQMKDGNALVNMASLVKNVRWNSTLKKRLVISLKAPQDVSWMETWILDASPIWHCELAGIPIIHHQDRAGLWKPEWRPWPGEGVKISISRPEAIPGPVITIDNARLELTPGRRFVKAGLFLKVRSSRGGQHSIVMPEDAVLQLVKINGKSQPIRQEKSKVMVPLRPGEQKFYLEWHQPSGSSIHIKGPEVRIGKQAVNAGITFKMPRNRWVLWTAGPRLGPAVLFWSYLLLIILVALGLGRLKLTPLKTVHWLILSLGLTQVPPLMAILIAGWLIALGIRKNHVPPLKWFQFNLTQLLLILWTLGSLFGLYTAIEKGLLGIPDMQVSGNGSSDFILNWTQDRIGPFMPQPHVLSIPIMVYHVFMLAWALWLAVSLLGWLRWGWSCFSEGGIWQKVYFRKEDPPPLNEEA